MESRRKAVRGSPSRCLSDNSNMTLSELALTVRPNAYSPYSGYKVGAALEDEQGRVWTGVNVENVSFGATVCAERSAVARMVLEGGKLIRRIAVATRDGGTPCGICLQTLLEFTDSTDSLIVEVVSESGHTKVYRLSELLPLGFATSLVPRTQ